jgi:hypothetical protein
MRRAMIPAFWMFCMMLLTPLSATLWGQSGIADLTGTWVGRTEMPGTPDKVDVTLVLKKAGKDYSGTISLGGAKNADLLDFSWGDEDTIQFHFTMPDDGDPVRIKVKLDFVSDEILGNKLMGSWFRGDGTYGALDLQRKK